MAENEEGQQVVRTVQSDVSTRECRLVKYSDGTVRVDHKAEGNTYLGSTCERGADDAGRAV